MIPSKLIDAYNGNRLVVCAGRGFFIDDSKHSEDQALAQSLLEKVHDSVSPEMTAEIHRLIQEGRDSEALEHLEYLLGRKFDQEVVRIMGDEDKDLNASCLALSRLRGKLAAVCTTSLDRMLERTMLWPPVIVPRGDLAQRRKFIFKVCGDLQQLHTWVLTREHERRVFEQGSARRTAFDSLYASHTFLFVGFKIPSREFSLLVDPVRIPDVSGAPPTHFVCTQASGLALERSLSRRGLSVVRTNPIEIFEKLSDGDTVETRGFSGCPYPGLQAFGQNFQRVFFGRDAEVSQVLEILDSTKRNNWLFIEGQSGVGKSSFVRAGLIPAIKERRPASEVLEFRPGRDSVCELSDAILGPKVQTRLPNVVFVDQFEEFAVMEPKEGRLQFDRTMSEALGSSNFLLITTMRSELAPGLFETFPNLWSHINVSCVRYVLPSISRAGLREAIVRPARLCGLSFEPGLVDQIMIDAQNKDHPQIDHLGKVSQEALPIVAHLMRELWVNGQLDGNLTFDEYLRLGGVSGALTRAADKLISQVTPDELDRIKRLLLHLVRRDGDRLERKHVRFDAAIEMLGGGSRAQEILSTLCGGAGSLHKDASRGRVLTLSSVFRKEATVMLIHRCLIDDWHTLAGWIRDNNKQLMLNAELRRRADLWRLEGFSKGSLPRGGEAQRILAAEASDPDIGAQIELQRAVAEEVRQRVSQDERKKRHRAVVLAVAAVILMVTIGAVSVYLLNVNRELQNLLEKVAKQNIDIRESLATEAGLRASSLASQGKGREANIVAIQGVQGYLTTGAARGRLPNESRIALAEAISTPGELIFSHHLDDLPLAVSYSESDNAVVVGGHGVTVVDVDGGAFDFIPFSNLERFPENAKMAPDAGFIVLHHGAARHSVIEVSHDRDVHEVSLKSQRGIRKDSYFRYYEKSNNIHSALTSDGSLYTWMSGGSASAEYRAPEPDKITDYCWSQNAIFATTVRGAVLAIDPRSLELMTMRSLAHRGTGVEIRCASDDDKAVSWANDDSLVVWAGMGLQQVSSIYPPSVSAVAIDRDGEQFAYGSETGAMEVLSTTSDQLNFSVPPHEGGVSGLAFSNDGGSIASIGEDKNINVWRTSQYKGRRVSANEPLIDGWTGEGHAFGLTGDKLVTYDLRRDDVDKWPLEMSAEIMAVCEMDPFVVAVADSDGNVEVVRREGSLSRYIQDLNNVSSLACNGAALIVGTTSGNVATLDSDVGNLHFRPGHSGSVTGTAVQQGFGLSWAQDDVRIGVWDFRDSANGRTLAFPGEYPTALAMSAEGVLVVGGVDGSIVAWPNFEDRGLVASYPLNSRIWDIEFISTSVFLASHHSGEVTVWRITGKIELIDRISTGGDPAVKMVSLSPMSEFIVLSGNNIKAKSLETSVLSEMFMGRSFWRNRGLETRATGRGPLGGVEVPSKVLAVDYLKEGSSLVVVEESGFLLVPWSVTRMVEVGCDRVLGRSKGTETLDLCREML